MPEYRIVRDETGHAFDEGTIVRRAVPTAEARSMGGAGDGEDTIFVTSGTDTTTPLDWEGGRNAWITLSTGEAEVVSQSCDTERQPQVGDRYRITRSGSHGFSLGTTVRLAQAGGAGDALIGNSAYMTTTEVLVQPPWQEGVTAFVAMDQVEYVSPGEALGEALVEAQAAQEPVPVAEHGAPPAVAGAGVHQRAPGSCTTTSPVVVPRSTPAAGPVQHLGPRGRRVPHRAGCAIRPGRGAGEALAEQRRREAAELLVDPEPDPDLPPPEEVLRLLREEHPALFVEEREQIASLLDQITVARAAVDEARQERALWLDRLITRSRVVANDNDWCGVYDSAMRALGLPGRRDEHDTDDDEDDEEEEEREDVTVTATIEISVDFDDEMFDSWFEDRHGVSISSRSNETDIHLHHRRRARRQRPCRRVRLRRGHRLGERPPVLRGRQRIRMGHREQELQQ